MRGKPIYKLQNLSDPNAVAVKYSNTVIKTNLTVNILKLRTPCQILPPHCAKTV